MTRRWIAMVVAALAALAVATAAQAGGWAVVVLDEVPGEARAGETQELGFTVRQHGHTPVDIHTWEGDLPTLMARHTETGETLMATARKDGAVGHYTVSVTFPKAGVWAWEIIPAPFAGTRFEPLTVLEAAPSRGASQASPVAIGRVALAASGAALLLAAAALALRSRRAAQGRGAVPVAR
jgi:hypothetical protein